MSPSKVQDHASAPPLTPAQYVRLNSGRNVPGKESAVVTSPASAPATSSPSESVMGPMLPQALACSAADLARCHAPDDYPSCGASPSTSFAAILPGLDRR